MNARSTFPFLLIAAIATCTACDRRETTGTSGVHREGQGDTPETAQNLHETATPPPPADPGTETPATTRSPEAPVAPPAGNEPPAQDTDTTSQEDQGDTLGRP